MLEVKTPAEVLAMIRTEFAPLPDRTELVPLAEALGRVLAEAVAAEEYVPDFDRSTVDGYACRAADTFGCSDAIPAILPVAGQVLMGEGADFELSRGECVYVPTGGAIPQGADCAVMIEYTEDYGDGTIGVMKPGAPGMNLIFRGDDVFPGKEILPAGRVLTAQDVGALAAIGRTTVPVARRLKVGVISTGDELVPPDAAPGPGQVRDVNSPLLTAMLTAFGAQPVNYGIVVDDEPLLRRKLETAARECDAVILSGGSSVGVKDAACRIIESMGKLLLHGIAVKPGKPTIMGKAGNKPLIGLPGHPVAACFVAQLFVLPLLGQLMGRNQEAYTVTAELTESLGANHGREQINACRLRREGDKLLAAPVRSKSGLITQLAGADGYFVISRDCEGLPKGAQVQVYLY
ncbi:MAG: molybdopterin molybdotransferase MoeA [Oscillospiraceae bacterium]|nr:molybdopterin molybdotransferase MoeA [Oscillospiraceae bacterium]